MQVRMGVAFPVQKEAPNVVAVVARAGSPPPSGAVTQVELDAALASDNVAADMQLGGGWG